MTDGRFKILVSDLIASEGIELLKNHADVDVKIGLTSHELKGIIEAYDALIVRSETRVSAEIIEAGERLQVVGRAGVGVDNIDLDAATNHGVAVVNAPTGNLLAAAEHTVALMLALARNVPQAGQSLKSGKWERGKFVGVELRNKTLGIIGL
ncbi:MAG: phosphoglycerate dehydrogenase, partial [Chloroflexi bacterium]|nr:phosphoglycerate dehydrogenase [Chloroflexota bacterium]